MKKKKEEPIILGLFPDNMMAPVESSNLKRVGHDPKKKILQVEFHNGAIWNYTPVSTPLYNNFLVADSKGVFFNAKIKNICNAEKIKG